jgi:CheY-like chemotaxis protein
VSAEGKKVLIVEDEAIIAMTAEDMLEQIGCMVSGIVATFAEAMAAVERGGFDVVLLDINLNGVASLPVAERLQQMGTPFVFATGYGSAGRGGEFENVPLVAKPYRIEALEAAIEQALVQPS